MKAKEMNAQWYSVEFYRDGGSMEITTNAYIYWFGIKGKRKYKPYVIKTIRQKEEEE